MINRLGGKDSTRRGRPPNRQCRGRNRVAINRLGGKGSTWRGRPPGRQRESRIGFAINRLGDRDNAGRGRQRGRQRGGKTRFAINRLGDSCGRRGDPQGYLADGAVRLLPGTTLRIRLGGRKGCRFHIACRCILSILSILNSDAGKQGGKFVYETLPFAVCVVNAVASNTLNDDSQQALIRQRSALTAAQLAGERTEVHGEVSVLGELVREGAKILMGSELDIVHTANRPESADVQIEGLGLRQNGCGGRHAIPLDANRGPALALWSRIPLSLVSSPCETLKSLLSTRKLRCCPDPVQHQGAMSRKIIVANMHAKFYVIRK